jgi:hypothetical protein
MNRINNHHYKNNRNVINSNKKIQMDNMNHKIKKLNLLSKRWNLEKKED